MSLTMIAIPLRRLAPRSDAWRRRQPALAERYTVRIGGTGIALAALREVATSLTRIEPGIRVDVLPSMGTPAASRRWPRSDRHRGRGASPEAGGEAEGPRRSRLHDDRARLCLVAQGCHGVTRRKLPALYADASPRWPDGTPLNVNPALALRLGESVSRRGDSRDGAGARSRLHAPPACRSRRPIRTMPGSPGRSAARSP
jgi:hypothetical protein